MDQSPLRWFGHVERMADGRLTKKLYEMEMQGLRCRGSPRKGWMDGVKEVFSERDLAIQEARNKHTR